MANIKDFIERVRTAILGIDVRDSIADTFEAINLETEGIKNEQEALSNSFKNLIINAGNSNAEIVDSRGEYSTLRERLDASDLRTGNELESFKSEVTETNNNLNKLVKNELQQMQDSFKEALRSASEYVNLFNDSNGACSTGTIINLSDDIENYYDIICACDFNGYNYNILVNNVSTLSLRGFNIADTASLSSKSTEFYEIGLRKVNGKAYEITRNNRVVISSSGAISKEVDSEYSRIMRIYGKRKIEI